jgi:hypothetical protein
MWLHVLQQVFLFLLLYILTGERMGWELGSSGSSSGNMLQLGNGCFTWTIS